MGYCAVECRTDDFYDHVESRLMMLTFAAHKQLLFEKIKQKIEEKEGAKLEKVADLLVEASSRESKDGREAERKREELVDKLRETFEE